VILIHVLKGRRFMVNPADRARTRRDVRDRRVSWGAMGVARAEHVGRPTK